MTRSGRSHHLIDDKAANANFTSAVIYPGRDLDTGVVQAQAANDPMAVGEGVNLVVEGRPDDDSGWIQIASFGNSGWDLSGVAYVQSAVGVTEYPQVRARVNATGGSSNTVNLWFVE